MSSTSHLVRWDVPFADARCASVSIITEAGGDIATLVVAPCGLDDYPKYSIRFTKVMALSYFEEAFAPERGYRTLPGIELNLCAYRWVGSPWVASYVVGADVFGWKQMNHFLILGGDSIVEVIAGGLPTVEQIDGPTTLGKGYEA